MSTVWEPPVLNPYGSFLPLYGSSLHRGSFALNPYTGVFHPYTGVLRSMRCNSGTKFTPFALQTIPVDMYNTNTNMTIPVDMYIKIPIPIPANMLTWFHAPVSKSNQIHLCTFVIVGADLVTFSPITLIECVTDPGITGVRSDLWVHTLRPMQYR